jgi:hypothetical protein
MCLPFAQVVSPQTSNCLFIRLFVKTQTKTKELYQNVGKHAYRFFAIFVPAKAGNQF